MTDAGVENDMSYDPLGKDALVGSVIMQMKIYDVLMALLQDTNPEVAARLDEAHSQGILLGLGPQFSHFYPRD